MAVRVNEVAVLNALRDWRRSVSTLTDIHFFHALDRGETGAQGTQSRLSVTLGPSQTRAVVDYVLTEEIRIVSLVDGRKGEIEDVLSRLLAALSGSDYLHGAAIHSHIYQGMSARIVSGGILLTVTWTGRISWHLIATEAAFDFTTAGLDVACLDATPGDPTSWAWDFGDSATSTEQSPAHTYALPGTYTVTLTARNRCGKSVATRDVTV
jgi:hypothetical protein